MVQIGGKPTGLRGPARVVLLSTVNCARKRRSLENLLLTGAILVAITPLSSQVYDSVKYLRRDIAMSQLKDLCRTKGVSNQCLTTLAVNKNLPKSHAASSSRDNSLISAISSPVIISPVADTT